MPLNKKGKKIKKAMVKQYGKKKGESVFYAMENSGKLRKVIKAVSGRDAGMGMAGKTGDFGGPQGGGNGRDPSKQYTTKTQLTQKQKEDLTKQRETARGRISPSTTPQGKAIAAGIGVLGSMFGVPGGYQIGKKMVDYSPMAFGVPKGRKTKDTTSKDKDGPQKITPPVIAGPVPVSPAPLSQVVPVRARPTVSPTGRFNYGFKKGGLLKQGKPKIAKKGWK
jgi:hypothetical protein